MMLPKNKRTTETLTGSIEPICFKDLVSRTQAIKFRAKTPNHIKSLTANKSQSKNPNKTQINFPLLCEPETDKMLTNFHLIQQERPVANQPLNQTIDVKKQKRSRIYSVQRKGRYGEQPVEEDKGNPKQRQKVSEYLRRHQRLQLLQNQQQRLLIFKSEINEFRMLYQSLGSILSSIKEDISDVENAISQYLAYIQNKKLSFIDDFLEGKERKPLKVIRQSRLQESLSVAYLFLEMAQSRMENHESYLTNFLGYCLSNVLLTARYYILKQKRDKNPLQQFEQAIKQIQIGSYGHTLTSLDDVTFRIQHNNEILVMMQKKLGRFNTKFQSCIQLFFKQAERKKTSCVQCTHYIFQFLSMHIHDSQLVGISKCLQVAPVPYCAPPTKPYTMVIEPLGVIFNKDRYRPYLFQFLQWASKYFQIVFWTWQMPTDSEVQRIIQRVEGYLTTKLFRYHCQNIDEVWVKDLQRLGRPLQKTLIIDFDKRIYTKQPKNGIEMRWIQKGIKKDKGLLFLCQILQQMVTTQSLVSDTLRIYAEQLFSISGF